MTSGSEHQCRPPIRVTVTRRRQRLYLFPYQRTLLEQVTGRPVSMDPTLFDTGQSLQPVENIRGIEVLPRRQGDPNGEP